MVSKQELDGVLIEINIILQGLEKRLTTLEKPKPVIKKQLVKK